MELNLEKLVESIVQLKGADIHLSTGAKPYFRLKNRLLPQEDFPILTKEGLNEVLLYLLPEQRIKMLYAGEEQDFAYSYKENTYRFRVNAYISQGNPNLVMRYLPSEFLTIEQLGLPPIVSQFAQLMQGFVLVTGPTGSGKSTSLSAIINQINHTREEKIITIEDPIEFVYRQDRSMISQREVGTDTKSFDRALTSALREDINVVLVGEMRDLETMRTAITAAETGHLVFSTLHTNSASQSINRIIDSFPSHSQSQIRTQLSNSLQGIVSQRLVPTLDGNLVPAVEILLVNNAVKSLIRENRVYQIDTVMETHLKEGMVTMNHSLFNLIRLGVVSYETALLYSPDPMTLKNMLKRVE